MARVREDQPLVPSLLDRLIDDEPGLSRETPKSRQQVLREMKASVRRDLEWLMNTRWKATSAPADLEELRESLAAYGIPDFAAVAKGGHDDREMLRELIEDVLRRHECRFKSVKVSLIKSSDPADRHLRLRIDALLHAEPAPEAVIFDSQVETLTGTFTLTQP